MKNLTLGQLNWIDKQIADQLADKVELSDGQITYFTIDPVKLNGGIEINALFGIRYTAAGHDFEYNSEEYKSERYSIKGSVAVVSVESWYFDAENNNDPVYVDLIINQVQTALNNLIL